MSLWWKELLEDGSLALIFALSWICPCANFYFILFLFFAYSKPCIVFILSLGGEGGHGMRILVTYIWVNQWWSHLADGVPSLCPLGAPESMWFSRFLGGYIGNVGGLRWVKHRKQISAIKVKMQVRKKSVAQKKIKKRSSLFSSLFVH